MRAWTAEEEAWLAEVYASEHSRFLSKAFAERFGYERSGPSIHGKAYSLGLTKLERDVPDRAVRQVSWCREPEMQAWMEANDRGQSYTELSRGFGERFGFPLSRGQIGLWRSANGRADRHHLRNKHRRVPVGTERDSGKGYILVKVADLPTKPQSKDNWRKKHVLVWEREHGPLPDGMVVMFADRDHSNFDPDNLVAVPKRLMGMINNKAAPEWSGADELRAAIALAELHEATVKAESRLPRACGVCGREFVPRPGSVDRLRQTCPDCLAGGRKCKGVRTVKGTRTCAVCGKEFGYTMSRQVRCPDCIAEKPRHSAKQQRRCRK